MKLDSVLWADVRKHHHLLYDRFNWLSPELRRHYVPHLFIYRCLIPKSLNCCLIVYSFQLRVSPTMQFIINSWWGWGQGGNWDSVWNKLCPKTIFFPKPLQRQNQFYINWLLEVNSQDCLYILFSIYLWMLNQDLCIFIDFSSLISL